MTKLDLAIKMTVTDYKHMVNGLKYIQSNQLGPSIQETDIRLGIDFDDYNDPYWIILTGDASYDQRHYMGCGASSIDLDSKPFKDGTWDILEDLINQCLDQINDTELDLSK